MFQILFVSNLCFQSTYNRSFVTSKSENCIDTVSECTLQLINDAEKYFDEDREIQNIKIERGRENRNREINHFEQSR